jgi:sulfate transport system permease protein
MGITLAYVGLLVLLPLAALVLKSLGIGPREFWTTVTSPRTLQALRLSFTGALVAAGINAAFGLLTAWVLARYRFPGRSLVDGLIDVPFALPTAVAGLALTALYAPTGWVGVHLDKLGVQAAYTSTGVVIAMVFVGLPFVVRTVQPVLADLEVELEEAAECLGAGPLATFRRVILPALLPAVIAGFALAFARAVGEFGSVIFIAGNLPGETEIAPLLIITRLEEFKYGQAATIGTAMLLLSFGVLILVNLLQAWSMRWARP